jgi:hypothetical protein
MHSAVRVGARHGRYFTGQRLADRRPRPTTPRTLAVCGLLRLARRGCEAEQNDHERDAARDERAAAGFPRQGAPHSSTPSHGHMPERYEHVVSVPVA